GHDASLPIPAFPLSSIVSRRIWRGDGCYPWPTSPRCLWTACRGGHLARHVPGGAFQRTGRSLGRAQAGLAVYGPTACPHSRLCADCDHCRSNRSGCEHGGVLGSRLCPDPTTALPRTRSARRSLGESARLLADGAFSVELPRLEGNEQRV